MDRPPLPSAPVVAGKLADRMRELVRSLLNEDPSQKSDTVWRFGSKGSLRIWISGQKRGKWQNYEDGQYGDALGLVAHLRRSTMKDAYGWSLDWLGVEREPREESDRRNSIQPLQIKAPRKTDQVRSDNTEIARQLWIEAIPARGTLVERYLASRRLTLPVAAPIRFHAACPRSAERLPAMVALMSFPTTGEPCGVHRTYLSADGGSKADGQAKMMLGRAGVVRLVPDADVVLGLGLAEGIETSLAVMQGFGWYPVWAATSAGAIATFPIVPGLEAITIFADADDGGVGLQAATACSKRWTDAGLDARIVIAPSEKDFADLLDEIG